MASSRAIFRSSPKCTSIPLFLAPAFTQIVPGAATAASSRAYTKGSKAFSQRPKSDRNKKRGVSAIRRTGPRVSRGLWPYPLPEPVARDNRTTGAQYEGLEDHGLWGFFNKDRASMIEPSEESSHGRAWTYKELSLKSFDDLHKLYWVCVKEQNRIMTTEQERRRMKAGYGKAESDDRVDVVRKTMTTIRDVLADRQLSHDQAHVLITQQYLKDLLPDQEPIFEDELAAIDESPLTEKAQDSPLHQPEPPR